MYASKLEVENWKNFKHGSVELGYRVFLIGPNAAGKSNFLDIFRFLRDISSVGGGLVHAVDTNRGGVSAIRCLYARRYPSVVINISVTDDDNNNFWEYKLGFTQDNNRRPIVQHESVALNNEILLNRPDEDDRADPVRRTETALEQTSKNREFRPLVQFFNGVSYQHLLPQVVRDPQGFSPVRIDNDPFGRDFLQRVESTQKRVRSARLRNIAKALTAATPNLSDLRVERDSYGTPHLIGVFDHWRPNAGKQSEAQFSDGTLRLFGLLWSLFEGNGPLLMEEPELSLHSEVVALLPLVIEKVNRYRKVKRQIIISTHSREILSDESIDASEVIRLEPSLEGTIFKIPALDSEERAQLDAGLTIADAILPKSASKYKDQLALFLD